MKLPVNPDVVRVCIKFYAYLKKVQVEALKALPALQEGSQRVRPSYRSVAGASCPGKPTTTSC